jgi:Ca2+-dependent lipid-binding protein
MHNLKFNGERILIPRSKNPEITIAILIVTDNEGQEKYKKIIDYASGISRAEASQIIMTPNSDQLDFSLDDAYQRLICVNLIQGSNLEIKEGEGVSDISRYVIELNNSLTDPIARANNLIYTYTLATR